MRRLHELLRFRRSLFILVNLLFFAIVISTVVLPAMTFFSDRDEQVADRSKVRERLRGIVAEEGNIQAIASDTKTQLQSGEFLAGANDNVIIADLQTRIKMLTEGAGTRSRTIQGLPVKTGGQLRYAGARVDIVGTIQSIQRAVYAIESAKPYLFIMAAGFRTAPTTNRPGVVEEPAIVAQLDVYGAMQIAGRDP
jgi:hypothetical protein